MTGPAPLIGEPLALDLVNTRPNGPSGPVDLLATPAGLANWLALQADRLPGFPATEAASLAADELSPIRVVRDQTAIAIDHVRRGRIPPAKTLEELNKAIGAAPAIRRLVRDNASITIEENRYGPFVTCLAARLAEAAADLLADPRASTIRECEAEDCVMLFLPAHPRRRWCSASRCGNRARVARYYERHKQHGSDSA